MRTSFFLLQNTRSAKSFSSFILSLTDTKQTLKRSQNIQLSENDFLDWYLLQFLWKRNLRFLIFSENFIGYNVFLWSSFRVCHVTFTAQIIHKKKLSLKKGEQIALTPTRSTCHTQFIYQNVGIFVWFQAMWFCDSHFTFSSWSF